KAASRARRASAPSPPSSPVSPAGRGSPAITRSSSTTAIPTPTASSWCERRVEMTASSELLSASDSPPVEHVNAEGKAPVLITGDHASRRVPKSLHNLGLDAESLKLHIGWDIGAAEVSRRLARALDAPAILAGYSRLVIDCNRDLGDPTSMPAV